MKLNTYLNYGGNCEEAFKFYKKHLGAKIVSIFRWSQMPDAGKHTPPGMENAVLHGRLAIADTVLMAADVPGPSRWAARTLLFPSRARRKQNESLECLRRAARCL